MPFVKRNQSNEIVATFARPQPNTNLEFLDDNHPDVRAFNTPGKKEPSDIAILLDLLLTRGDISPAGLEAARQRLRNRP